MRKRLSDSIDKGFINKIILESGYNATVDEIFAVVDKWFYDIKPEADISKVEEHIYLSNNHGSMQIQLKNEYSRSDAKGKKFFKIRKYISLIFPVKENIYKAYPVCESRNYPVVVCWLYRWFSVLVSGKKKKKWNKNIS